MKEHMLSEDEVCELFNTIRIQELRSKKMKNQGSLEGWLSEGVSPKVNLQTISLQGADLRGASSLIIKHKFVCTICQKWESNIDKIVILNDKYHCLECAVESM